MSAFLSTSNCGPRIVLEKCYGYSHDTINRCPRIVPYRKQGRESILYNESAETKNTGTVEVDVESFSKRDSFNDSYTELHEEVEKKIRRS